MASKIRSLLSNKILQAIARSSHLQDTAATSSVVAAASSKINYDPLLLPLLRIDLRNSTSFATCKSSSNKNNSNSGINCSNNSTINGNINPVISDDNIPHGISSPPYGYLGYTVYLSRLLSCLTSESNTDSCSLPEFGSELLQGLETDDGLLSAHLETNPRSKEVLLKCRVSFAQFSNDVLHSVLASPKDHWRNSSLLSTIPHQKVVLDYSSPNIAKPFHVGHLRSTIMGNSLARLHEALGHTVTRINYLGDWGTQFGMIKYGFDAKGLCKSDLQEDAIRKLYDVYVWANQQAEHNDDVMVKAKKVFTQLEQGDQQQLDMWRFFRDISVKDLRRMYERLGITFDEYHGESQYPAAECAQVVRDMDARQLLTTEEDGGKVFHYAHNKKVAIVKNDGSCLYLTRDIAAAIDRHNRYKFDRLYYVVDNAQISHFVALFSSLTKLGYNWAGAMRHVRFGRIVGLSSRKGNAALLSDLLDEGTQQKMEDQRNSYTTQVSGDEAIAAAEQVALSAVMVADLKNSRRRDYNFSWNAALKGNSTGVSLQYTHCRLVQLESNCGVRLNPSADTAILSNYSSAVQLIAHIARFEEVLYEYHERLEPCVLVGYLFSLKSSIKAALNELSVRHAPTEEAEARLLLFVAARHILAAGLHIVGLKPLDKM